MTDAPERVPLDPQKAAQLAEFARTCKAAARAVSLYPPAHPAIGVSLQRLTEAARHATAEGALRLQIRTDAILIDGFASQKPDPAIAELAALLHRHLIGGLVLQGAADADSWRALMQLLARAPEEVRADGGIAHLWATAGGPSIEILEVDYAEVLRERGVGDASLDEIIDACLLGQPLAEWDDQTRETMAVLFASDQHLPALVERLELRLAGQSAETKSAAFLNLLRRVAEQVQEQHPDQLDPVFTQLARATAGLPAETVAGLLRERDSPEAIAGGLNVVGAVVERMSDELIVDFVARTVIAERSPTARLAEAFQALVPEVDRRRQLVSFARERVADSPLANEDSFEGMWARVETMLVSYTDSSFVSEDYARELSGARNAAVDVDRVSDDPPERVSAWLATISDSALRGLDMQLLLDLLRIEADPARWRDVAETVVTHAEDLARAGLVDPALELADIVATEATAQGQSPRKAHAARALDRLGRGTLVRHATAQLRSGDDAIAERVARLCHAIGSSIIPSLAERLATEQDDRARLRLRQILVGFGPSGREAIQQLLDAPNWEVRRTAAFLLREFGGTESLGSLRPLLNDDEPLVQREAIQSIILDGSEAAFDMLRSVLIGGATSRARESLVRELATLRDERSAPLFCYLVKQLDRGRQQSAYQVSLDALGACGGPEAVEALEFALRQGEWWAPRRTSALKRRAALALKRIGSNDAVQALRRSTEHASYLTRRAAKAALAGTGG